MSVERYVGDFYIVEVASTPFPDGILFTITAIDRASGRCSQINDLNAILSEFIEEEDDLRIEDKDWLLSAKEHESFEKRAQRLFSSKDSLRYFESKLDEDRREGEWANTRRLWWIQRFRWWMYEFRERRLAKLAVARQDAASQTND